MSPSVVDFHTYVHFTLYETSFKCASFWQRWRKSIIKILLLMAFLVSQTTYLSEESYLFSKSILRQITCVCMCVGMFQNLKEQMPQLENSLLFKDYHFHIILVNQKPAYKLQRGEIQRHSCQNGANAAQNSDLPWKLEMEVSFSTSPFAVCSWGQGVSPF